MSGLDVALHAEISSRTENHMTDLSSDLGTPTARRPLSDDLDVRLAAVHAHWSRICDWLAAADDMSESELEAARDKIVREIVNALEHGESGYHVCRTLDRVGWSPDDDLVEIMSDVLRERLDALSKIEAAWVTANDIRPARAVGEAVTIAKRPGTLGSRVAGEVIEVDLVRGRYLVFSSALGHVRKNNRASGTLGRYVNFEDVLAPSTSEVDP